VRAAEWVSDHVGRLIDRSPRSDLDQFTVKTGQRYPQPSLVAVINNESQESAIVIGAHIDTLGGRMPGAGDDGSGSACLLEIARILSQSELEFKRPIYLIWYAAEEQGLVGSQFVVNYFQSHQIPVKAVLQLDMTGFRNNKNDPTIWIYDDNTDEHLNLFLADLMTVYLGIPNAHSSCGYGCSDHASWQAKGIPASFPCETDFEHHNNKIHTAEDTIDRLTPEHMVNFTKLGIAFAVELALS
jgi:leucyl aminopeptidase